MDSVIEIVKRSGTLHNTKYAIYIGDGDSKTFRGILDAHPYDDLVVEKTNASTTFKNV